MQKENFTNLVAIGLGSSLGHRRVQLELAARQLASKEHMHLIRVSRWYLTPPMVGGTARCPFINGVALFETSLAPLEILEICRDLEARAGRRRARFWADRPLDLDILLYGQHISDDPQLTLPHPAIADRPFVLIPLREVWPSAVNPRTGELWATAPTPKGPKPVAIGVASTPHTLYQSVRALHTALLPETI